MTSLRWLKLNRTGLCYLPEELSSLQKLVIVNCKAESQSYILQLDCLTLVFFLSLLCEIRNIVRESQQPDDAAWRAVKSSQPEGNVKYIYIYIYIYVCVCDNVTVYIYCLSKFGVRIFCFCCYSARMH